MIYYISNQLELGIQNTPEITYTSDISLLLDWIKTKKYIQLDTETKNEELDLVQFGDYDTQFVIDYTPELIPLLKSIIEDDSKVWLLQNAKFDFKQFYKIGIEIPKIYDTFLAECIITNGLQGRKLGLGALTQKYCGIELDKSIRGKNNYEGHSQRVIVYAANDVKYLEVIKHWQEIAIKSEELEIILDIECEVVKVYALMELQGMKLDVEAWKKVYEENLAKLIIIENELDAIVKSESRLSKFVDKYVQAQMFGFSKRDVNIHWSSPLQVKQVFRTLGIDIDSVAEGKIISFNTIPIVKKYLEWKDIQTQCSKFGLDYLKNLDPDGRVRFDIWQILDTARIAVKEPNILQLPADNRYRNCFVTEEGNLFVDADYGSQEAILMAIASNEAGWLTPIKNNWDLHSYVAERVYKAKWTNAIEEGCVYKLNYQKCSCKQHKLMRDRVKTLNYAYAYGAGPKKVSESFNVSIPEAKQIINDYENSLPDLKKLFRLLKSYGTTHFKIRCMKPFRGVRYFDRPDPNDFSAMSSIERQSGNTHIQMTGAYILKLALIYLYRETKKIDYPVKITIAVHDQILCEVPKEHIEDWKQRQIFLMKYVSDIVTGYDVRIDVDCNITNKWNK